MQTMKRPYELLLRWDQQGRLSGAHVQHRYVIEDGGKIVGESVGPAEPLSLETAEEFPLADILTQAQSDALVGKAAAEAERDTARAAHEDALAALSQVTAERDTLAAALASRA